MGLGHSIALEARASCCPSQNCSCVQQVPLPTFGLHETGGGGGRVTFSYEYLWAHVPQRPELHSLASLTDAGGEHGYNTQEGQQPSSWAPGAHVSPCLGASSPQLV